jgi:hypothetical protein
MPELKSPYFEIAQTLALDAFTSPIERGKTAYHDCVAAVADIGADEPHRLRSLADRLDQLSVDFALLADAARMKAGA